MQTTTEEKRIFISENAEAFQQLRAAHMKVYHATEEALQSFRAIGIGEIESLKELQAALEAGPQDFVNRKIENHVGVDALRLGALSIKREMLSQVLNVGDPQPFISAMTELKRVAVAPNAFKYIKIDDGAVIIDQESLDADSHELASKFVSGTGLLIYKKLEQAANSLSEVNGLLQADSKGEYMPSLHNLSRWFTQKDYVTFELSPEKVNLLSTFK